MFAHCISEKSDLSEGVDEDEDDGKDDDEEDEE